MTIDQSKLEAFMHQAVAGMAAGMSGVMTTIGHKLGLYKAMAGDGPMTAAELATKTGTHERYVREWLNNQAAGGYVSYDPAERTYELPDEQAMVLGKNRRARRSIHLRLRSWRACGWTRKR